MISFAPISYMAAFSFSVRLRKLSNSAIWRSTEPVSQILDLCVFWIFLASFAWLLSFLFLSQEYSPEPLLMICFLSQSRPSVSLSFSGFFGFLLSTWFFAFLHSLHLYLSSFLNVASSCVIRVLQRLEYLLVVHPLSVR